MDVEAKPIGNDIWVLMDLLHRPVGSLVQTSRGFLIEHDGAGILAGIEPGPYDSIVRAMQVVGTRSRGSCRIVSG